MPFTALTVFLTTQSNYIITQDSMCSLLSLSLLYKHTSGHLFHEDLDVPILRNGAQVLNNVPVLQVLVKRDLFMKGLRVPDPQRERGRERDVIQFAYSFSGM